MRRRPVQSSRGSHGHSLMKISAELAGAALGSAWLGWLVSSFILFALFWMLESQSAHPMAYQITVIVLMLIGGSLLNALIAGAALGVWWHAIASKRGLRRRVHYWLPGLIAGAAVGLALSVVTLAGLGRDWWSWAFVSTPYAAACGGFEGLFLWLWLRPDRDAQPNPPTAAP